MQNLYLGEPGPHDSDTTHQPTDLPGLSSPRRGHSLQERLTNDSQLCLQCSRSEGTRVITIQGTWSRPQVDLLLSLSGEEVASFSMPFPCTIEQLYHKLCVHHALGKGRIFNAQHADLTPDTYVHNVPPQTMPLHVVETHPIY